MATILLAEDDPAMRRFLENALKKEQHQVHVCSDGLEALTAIEQGNCYDLLLTDIIMPGLDGIELSEKATILCPAMKTMFITGFSGFATQTSQSSRADKIMTKPFHLADLLSQVKTVLSS